MYLVDISHFPCRTWPHTLQTLATLLADPGHVPCRPWPHCLQTLATYLADLGHIACRPWPRTLQILATREYVFLPSSSGASRAVSRKKKNTPSSPSSNEPANWGSARTHINSQTSAQHNLKHYYWPRTHNQKEPISENSYLFQYCAFIL